MARGSEWRSQGCAWIGGGWGLGGAAPTLRGPWGASLEQWALQLCSASPQGLVAGVCDMESTSACVCGVSVLCPWLGF